MWNIFIIVEKQQIKKNIYIYLETKQKKQKKQQLHIDPKFFFPSLFE